MLQHSFTGRYGDKTRGKNSDVKYIVLLASIIQLFLAIGYEENHTEQEWSVGVYESLSSKSRITSFT